uniref:NADH dehydrogenase subunit 6 n=1 Tax=Piagetiella africana TaxID=2965260 RepID=UPI00286AFEC2|nr:NADH dehydrogenase subunit 6 [Piagetiella africana]WKF19579.1 NADH dehydrogenase subunit 6 [Piagetiella africana]
MMTIDLFFSVMMFSGFLFSLSKNLVEMMVCLILFCLSGAWVSYMMISYPIGVMFMVLVIVTGLFLVFSFIVSLSPQYPVFSSVNQSFCLFFWFFSLIYFSWNWVPVNSNLVFNNSLKDLMIVDSQSSVLLIILLLYIVVSYVRFTYSKGGGLRKMY